jgi:DNA end-binding protein Ku
MLVEQLTSTFDPDKYTDDYRTALLDLIEEKKAENTVTANNVEKELPDNVTDLMSALQASLNKTKKKTTRKRTKPLKEKTS